MVVVVVVGRCCWSVVLVGDVAVVSGVGGVDGVDGVGGKWGWWCRGWWW